MLKRANVMREQAEKKHLKLFFDTEMSKCSLNVSIRHDGFTKGVNSHLFLYILSSIVSLLLSNVQSNFHFFLFFCSLT